MRQRRRLSRHQRGGPDLRHPGWPVRQAQGLGHGRTSSLEHMHLQRVRARPHAQREPQRRGRGLGLRMQRPEHEEQAGMLGRTGVEAADLRRPCLRQPAQHGTDAARLERLFGGPQAFGRGVGRDPDQAVIGQAFAGQPWQKRRMRRPDHQHTAALAHQPGHGRAQQPPFGLAALHLQHLGERLRGPATTGQFGIECRVPAGDDLATAHAHGLPGPDGLGQV